MDVEDFVSPQFRRNARIVGNGEVAWRGTDILSVLREIADSGFAILGLESVVFPFGSQPLVEAISDSSAQSDRRTKPWESWVAYTVSRSIADLERTVPNPYGDDVWYIIVAFMKDDLGEEPGLKAPEGIE